MYSTDTLTHIHQIYIISKWMVMIDKSIQITFKHFELHEVMWTHFHLHTKKKHALNIKNVPNKI